MSTPSATEVKYLVNTAKSDTDIDAMVTLAVAELTALLGGGSMSDGVQKLCNIRLTAIMIAGSDPNSSGIGGTEMDFTSRKNEWRRYVNEQVRIATREIRVN